MIAEINPLFFERFKGDLEFKFILLGKNEARE
jgi:hypothetical protein